jgi:hypothetical protein
MRRAGCKLQRTDGRARANVARCGHFSRAAACGARSWRGFHDPLGAFLRKDRRSGISREPARAVGKAVHTPETPMDTDSTDSFTQLHSPGARERCRCDDRPGHRPGYRPGHGKACWAMRETWTQSDPWQKPDFRKQLGMVGGIDRKRAVARPGSWRGRSPDTERSLARARSNARVPGCGALATGAGMARHGGRRCSGDQRGIPDRSGSCGLPEGGIEP